MFADLTSKLSDLLQHPGEAFSSVLTVVLLATVGLVLLHLVLALMGGRAIEAAQTPESVGTAGLSGRIGQCGRARHDLFLFGPGIRWHERLVAVRPYVWSRGDDGRAAVVGDHLGWAKSFRVAVLPRTKRIPTRLASSGSPS